MIEFYRNTIWKLQKHLIKRPLRCRKCIALDLYEKIDKCTNLCEFCSQNTSKRIDSPVFTDEDINGLESMLQNRKSRSLFMFSGGKDSTYLLSKLCDSMDEAQKRITCLFVDNGQTHINAIKNVENITSKLNLNLLVVKNKKRLFEKLFYQAINDLDNYKGLYHTVDKLDGDTIFETAADIANTMNFDYIISGLSWAQLKFIIGTDKYWFDKHNTVFVNPLAVWQPTEDIMTKHLISRGLIKKGKTNPLATNNQLILPLTVLDIKKFGYSTFEPEFVNMIRAGQLDGELWRDIFDILIMFTKLGLLNKPLKDKVKEICQTKRLTL